MGVIMLPLPVPLPLPRTRLLSGPRCDHERPRERKQGLAAARGVGFAKTGADLAEECLGLFIVEVFEHGTQRGSLEPFEDRVFSLEAVEVGGLPSGGLKASMVELGEVPLR